MKIFSYLYITFSYLITFFHELAHVLAYSLFCPKDIFKVRIGIGIDNLQGLHGFVSFGNITEAGICDLPNFHVLSPGKQIVILLAGSMANLLTMLLGVAFLWLGMLNSGFLVVLILALLASVWLVLNLFTLWDNLFFSQHKFKNDGDLIKQALCLL